MKREQRAMVRETHLRELGYQTYDAYLRSPAWLDVKARFRASDMPQLCMCGAKDGIQLHHTTYERVGRERVDDLVALCSACHATAHALEAAGVIGLDLKGFYYDLNRAYAYAGPERVRKARAADDFDDGVKARAALLEHWRRTCPRQLKRNARVAMLRKRKPAEAT